MAGEDQVVHLERRLELALAEIDRLRSIEEIRDCIYRLCRGTDRIDAQLLQSAFHPGALVHFGKLFDGPAVDWIEAGVRHQKTQAQRQHLVGNILVRFDGETAVAESYELDRHKATINGEVRDLVLAARTLDRFERRDGQWRIVERTKVMDWGRAISADDGLYQNSPLIRGGDDRADASYELLP